jgi:uncharacterized protein YeaO (DUF488 family)
MIRIKRIYEPAAEDDGLRILVDRVWPRGISRYDAKIDHWFREIAPSTDLRKWFGHKPERWQEFRRRYGAELKANPALQQLHALTFHKRATLLYAARDCEHNNAVALRSVLDRLARSGRRSAG